FLRRVVLRVPVEFTWVVLLFVVAVGIMLPMVISFLASYRDWRYEAEFYWLLTNPGFAMWEVGRIHAPHAEAFWGFAAVWAILATGVNLPWFLRQARRFRPPEPIPFVRPIAVAPEQMEVTRTAP